MPPRPGTQLGPYEILAPIGAGGMGEVYRALDPRLGREVAIKVLPEHFAEDDPAIAGISGALLLARTLAIVRAGGFGARSCDATVICDRPAIAPRRDDLRARLADVLELPLGAVSVKATRPEGLGLAGDGVGCMAVAVLT